LTMKQTKKSVEKALVAKILRTVQSYEGFRFNRSQGDYTGKNARSLKEFSSILKSVDIRSINFHFKRGDFQKWVQNIVGDIELSNNIRKIPKDLHGEKLRTTLTRIINDRITELKLA